MMKWDISVECASAIIICIILINANRVNTIPRLKNIVFQNCLRITFLSCLTNILSTFLLQYIHEVPLFINEWILIFYFICTPLMGGIYFLYTVTMCYEEDKRAITRCVKYSCLPAILYVALVISNFFTKALFTIDSSGYQQGDWISTTYIIFYFYVFLSLFVVLLRRKYLERLSLRILIMFPFLSSFIVLLQQYFFPSVILTGFAAMCSLLVIYLYLQNKLMFTDPLTHLLNRQEFSRMIEMKIDQGQTFSILAVSLKEFKFINDKFGQQIGDKLIIALCEFLSTVTYCNNLYRYSGDEFVFLLNSDKEVNLVVEKIQTRMSAPWVVDTYDYNLNYCLGSVVYPDVAKNEQECIFGLEYAIAQVKKEKELTYLACSVDMLHEIQRNEAIIKIMKQGIQEDSFQVLFQPIYDYDLHCFNKAEALLRLPENQLGFVSPNVFIPIAEESGMITEITFQVLDKTCKFIHSLLEQGIKIDGISVNFSIVLFMQEDLERKVLEIIERNEIPYDKIKIEITESMLSMNYDTIVSFIQTMEKKGIRFLLDDFGTGYSNLSYVLNIPFHTIKIDKSLVWKAMEDKHSDIIIGMIVSAFKQMDLYVIAEGIETKGQSDRVIAYGCNAIQGFLYAKPQTAQAALSLFAQGYEVVYE